MSYQVTRSPKFMGNVMISLQMFRPHVDKTTGASCTVGPCVSGIQGCFLFNIGYRQETNIWVCLKMVSSPLYPMVDDQTIPFLNGYFIGNIPIFRQKHMEESLLQEMLETDGN